MFDLSKMRKCNINLAVVQPYALAMNTNELDFSEAPCVKLITLIYRVIVQNEAWPYKKCAPQYSFSRRVCKQGEVKM